MAKTKIKEVAIGTNSDYYLRLYYEETNVDTVNNRSDVTISLYGYTERAAAYCSWNGYGGNSFTVVIDGTSYTLSSQNVDTSDWRTEHYLHSKSLTINHNANGSKSITVSGSMTYQGGGTSLVAGTYSTGNVTQSLTTIARASTVGTTSNTTITSSSGNVTININKKNSNYYDQIVTTGAISKTINIGTASSGMISWSDLLSAMSSTTSATLNITVKTYSNSGYSTLIGSNTGTADIKINTNNIKPSISFSAISVNASGLSGKLVAGVSTAKAKWTVTNATGASVSKVVVSGSNCSIASGSSAIGTSGTPVTAQLPSRTSDYTITLTATVTDSRGATASATTSGATVYGYAPPNLTFNAYRVASSSATTADPTGAYVYTTFSASAGASVGGSNSASISSKTPQSITDGGHYALATNATKAFTVVAKDTVGNTTSKTINISTALIPFDLYSNAAGTSVGVGVGEAAQSGRFSSALPAYFKDMIYDGQTAMIGLNASSGGDGWYLVTSGTATGYADVGLTFLFSEGYVPRGIGIYTVNFRCDNGSSLSISRNGWLVRTGSFNVGDVKAYTSGNNWYIYIYKGNTYGTIHARILSSTGTSFWRSHLMQNNTTVLSSASGTAATDIGITGSMAGTVAIANGGTGKTTAADAFTALSGFTLDTSTNNTADTWVPVFQNSKIQHRVIPTAYNSTPLTVGNGGTGATSAAGARSKLGVNQPSSSSSVSIAGNTTQSISVTTANYNFYLFKFTCNSRITTIFTTYSQLSTSGQYYWIYDGTSSGAEVIITRAASSISIKRDGGTACSVVLTYWN